MLRPAFEQDEWILIAVGAALGFMVGIFQLVVLFGDHMGITGSGIAIAGQGAHTRAATGSGARHGLNRGSPRRPVHRLAFAPPLDKVMLGVIRLT